MLSAAPLAAVLRELDCVYKPSTAGAGLACLIVAIHHLPVPHALYHQSWLQNGAPMLELFFLISGFVISLVFAEMAQTPRGAAAFSVRVLGRLWPIHVAMLLALALIRSVFAEHGGFSDQMTLEALGAQLLLIQTWVGLGLSWSYPAWTLSAELAAYLLFAFLMLITRSRAGQIAGASAMAILAGIIFLGELGPRDHYNVISVARRTFALNVIGHAAGDRSAYRRVVGDERAARWRRVFSELRDLRVHSARVCE